MYCLTGVNILLLRRASATSARGKIGRVGVLAAGKPFKSAALTLVTPAAVTGKAAGRDIAGNVGAGCCNSARLSRYRRSPHR